MKKSKKSLNLETIQILPITPLSVRPNKKGEYHVLKAVGERLIAFGIAKKFTKTRKSKTQKEITTPPTVKKISFFNKFFPSPSSYLATGKA